MGRVRELTREDLPWVTEIAAARRRSLVDFAPRFWRPATAATAVHTAFLGSLIDANEVLSVRTEHGFLFGMPRDNRLLIDDLALEEELLWSTEGVALLSHALANDALRVVCPCPETARRAAVESLGAKPVESWWHRDLEPLGQGPSPTQLKVEGAEGRLVEAPPVYAPGGPVLLVTEVRDKAALGEIERAAARCGATVSVVSLPPDDISRTGLLMSSGYRPTTDFFETPRRASDVTD
jgi:hypothetical protein